MNVGFVHGAGCLPLTCLLLAGLAPSHVAGSRAAEQRHAAPRERLPFRLAGPDSRQSAAADDAKPLAAPVPRSIPDANLVRGLVNVAELADVAWAPYVRSAVDEVVISRGSLPNASTWAQDNTSRSTVKEAPSPRLAVPAAGSSWAESTSEHPSWEAATLDGDSSLSRTTSLDVATPQFRSLTTSKGALRVVSLGITTRFAEDKTIPDCNDIVSGVVEDVGGSGPTGRVRHQDGDRWRRVGRLKRNGVGSRLLEQQQLQQQQAVLPQMPSQVSSDAQLTASTTSESRSSLSLRSMRIAKGQANEGARSSNVSGVGDGLFRSRGTVSTGGLTFVGTTIKPCTTVVQVAIGGPYTSTRKRRLDTSEVAISSLKHSEDHHLAVSRQPIPPVNHSVFAASTATSGAEAPLASRQAVAVLGLAHATTVGSVGTSGSVPPSVSFSAVSVDFQRAAASEALAAQMRLARRHQMRAMWLVVPLGVVAGIALVITVASMELHGRPSGLLALRSDGDTIFRCVGARKLRSKPAKDKRFL